MSTEAWVLITYLAGALLWWIPITLFFVRHEDMDDDAADIAMAIGIGLCVTFIWPLLIPGFWVYKVIKMQLEEDQIKERRK